MANYAVTTQTYNDNSLAVVLSQMETYIETIVDTKTIYIYGVHPKGSGYIGAIVHDT